MERPKCKTCVHWLEGDDEDGWCLRFPPAVSPIETIDDEANYPYSDAGSYCGEHPDFPAYLEWWRQQRQSPPGKIET